MQPRFVQCRATTPLVPDHDRAKRAEKIDVVGRTLTLRRKSVCVDGRRRQFGGASAAKSQNRGKSATRADEKVPPESAGERA
jgi:hypothetical protein